ncbi:RDD family protein [Methanolobus sp. ZRKC2]|uniref:RDD family protein n=1 Tax=Methanolobus sp. ZRKC2 TaxID=3125783 RepID=UPI00324E5EEA
MYCQNCDTSNPDDVTHCSNCGAYVENTPEYAGFWKRFFAAIVDNIIVIVVGGIAAVFLGAVFGGITGSVVGIFASEGFIPTFFSTLLFFIIAFYLLIRWLYFAIMESSSYQATFGKQLLSIKVTDMELNRISFWRATLRYFAKILSELIFFIGYLMIGFTEKKQGLHDIIANCLVVNDRK